MNNKELIYNKISDFVRKYYLNKLLRGAIFFVLITLLTFIVYAVLSLSQGVWPVPRRRVSLPG